MYCQKCGKELAQDARFCLYCGNPTTSLAEKNPQTEENSIQYPTTGEPQQEKKHMYCPNCGKEIAEESKFCLHCGAPTNKFVKEEKSILQHSEAQPSKKSAPHMKYSKQVQKINILTMGSYILLLLFVVLFLTLPIFQISFEASLEDIESWDQFEEAMENKGIVKQNFSFMNELSTLVNSMERIEDEPEVAAALFFSVPFLLLVIISSVIILCTTASKAYNKINDITNIERSSLIAYHNIKDPTNEAVVRKWFEKQSISSILIYAAFDVVFGKIDKAIIQGIFETDITVRNMQLLTGVSGNIIILVVILIVYFIVKKMIEKEEAILSYDILSKK